MAANSRSRNSGAAVWQSLAAFYTALSDRNVARLLGTGRISEIGDCINMVAS